MRKNYNYSSFNSISKHQTQLIPLSITSTTQNTISQGRIQQQILLLDQNFSNVVVQKSQSPKPPMTLLPVLENLQVPSSYFTISVRVDSRRSASLASDSRLVKRYRAINSLSILLICFQSPDFETNS